MLSWEELDTELDRKDMKIWSTNAGAQPCCQIRITRWRGEMPANRVVMQLNGFNMYNTEDAQTVLPVFADIITNHMDILCLAKDRLIKLHNLQKVPQLDSRYQVTGYP